jgi:L-aminopeptidase/D-esterase-like protein
MTELRNLLTDVEGVSVGHAQDARLASGATCILFDAPAVAAVDVRGGGPGTRETDLLEPSRTVQTIDAIVLSGGSAFGLDAASGAQAYLREQGRGFAIGPALVPIVPSAVLFDLLNGGDKDWGRYPPYRELGYAAAAAAGATAARGECPLGSVGAGTGATTVNFKGGIGAASMVTEDQFTVAALAAVNAAGSAVVGNGPWFWAAPFERGAEFGRHGFPQVAPPEALLPRTKNAVGSSTTLVVVVTDATLTKAQAQRIAMMAQDGFAHAITPVHTPLDGDLVFAAATGRKPLNDPIFELLRLGAAAAQTVARAIARGVYEATALAVPSAVPAYRDTYPD